MIIFVNGAFGVGKTTVAEHVVRALPNSMLFDPEEVGFCLRNILSPVDPVDDFQSYAMWRSLTVETARLIRETYGLDMVIPMTIWRRSFFDEVMDGLRAFERDVRHFCLIASVETIYERLEKRCEQLPGSWSHSQAENAVAAFKSPKFETRVSADHRAADEIADLLLASIQHHSAASCV